jgi:fumarate reductase flavoprotein subunit
MDLLQHDILIVGGGGAGLRAAIAIGEENPRLSVGIVSKVYPMRSHTVSAEGGAAAVIKPNDSLMDHARDTIKGSDWLADQDAVWAFVNEAPREMIQLERWGCPWSRDSDGHVAVRPFGGMQIERTWFAADKTGFHMLHALFQTVLKFRNVTRYDEWFAVICTGGAGRVFPFTTNAAIKTGDGMALAYRAGAPLKDMEFVQYHPTGLPGTGILITEAARGEGGILVNNKGERYLQHYNLGQPVDVKDPRHPQKQTMELGPRDRLSQAFVMEDRKGNTFQGPYGSYVHLDVRHLGEKKINKKIPFVRELSKNYVGIDPVYEPIPVRPVVHYMMGGISTDITGKVDNVQGLYAAGECACVSINGANRLGSNSLTELLVFGARAARSAVRFIEGKSINAAALRAQADDEQRRLRQRWFDDRGTAHRETIAGIRAELNRTMEEGCGIYRTEQSLQATCQKLRELKQRYQNVAISDKTNSFNTELTSAIELGYLLDAAEAVAFSALARKESRGSHQREDFKQRDDAAYLKHSLAYRSDGDPRIEYKDVALDPENRWPLGERTYGQKK